MLHVHTFIFNKLTANASWIHNFFDIVMMKFINNRTDALKVGINLFFYANKLSNCPLLRVDVSHKLWIHVSVCLLVIKISQWADKIFCSYRKLFEASVSCLASRGMHASMVRWGSSHTVFWLLRHSGAITHFLQHKTKNLFAHATSWSLTLSSLTVHQCHTCMWVERLVLSFPLFGLQEICSGCSSWSPSWKQETFPNSNSTWMEEWQENHPPLMWLPL